MKLKGNFFTDGTDIAVDMAFASSLPGEEHLLCSICLDVFTQPVTTPCGHNYCQACIKGYWGSSEDIHCPLCKRQFHSKPQLHVNTEFRDMVEHFSKMRVRTEDQTPAKPGEVSCDICPELKLKAQKTCTVCLVSYCQFHLEPHQRVATFKKHKLIDPVSNLEDRVCKKHGKMFELFCHTDQMCVCFMCLKHDHVMHESVPLEHMLREMKAQLEDVTSKMRIVEDTKTKSINEVKYLSEQKKKESDKVIADIDGAFTSLVASLQMNQMKLVELIQEKQKAVDKQAEDHIRQLEQEVDESRSGRSKLEQLLQTEDDFCLLQSWSSLYVPADHKDLLHPLSCFIPPLSHHLSGNSQQNYVGMVQKAVAQMEMTLSNEMETLIHVVRLSDGCEGTQHLNAAAKPKVEEFSEGAGNPFQDKLMMIQQCDAVDVTLDTLTANPKFLVSEDGKQLRLKKSQFQMFFTPLVRGRFQDVPYVLGKDGYSSGRFYYEVQVSESKDWVLGVTKEICKYESSIPVSKKSWVLIGVNNGDGFISLTVNIGRLHPMRGPQTIGVFVDHEKGEVSFYDVDARTLIYTYTGCDFTQTIPIAKAIVYYLTGIPCSQRQKLHPLFSVLGQDPNNVITITPVGYSNY